VGGTSDITSVKSYSIDENARAVEVAGRRFI
jgi:hypothetical protein